MALPKNPNRLWPEHIVKDLVKQAKERVGAAGWRYLSYEMRSALISEKCLLTVMGTERGEIPCAAIGTLLRDMRQIAGLND